MELEQAAISAMAEVERVLESHASDELMKSLNWKREVSKAKTLFEITGQLPSPSKDFVQFKITAKGIVWRKWKISIRGVSKGTAPTPQPSEVVMNHRDFQYDEILQVRFYLQLHSVSMVTVILLFTLYPSRYSSRPKLKGFLDREFYSRFIAFLLVTMTI